MNTQTLHEYCEKWIAIARRTQDGQHLLKNYHQKRYWIGIEDAHISMLHFLDEEKKKEAATARPVIANFGAFLLLGEEYHDLP